MTTAERGELSQLRRENRQLRLEREILKHRRRRWLFREGGAGQRRRRVLTVCRRLRAAKIKSVEDAHPSVDLGAMAPSAGEKMFAQPMAGIACYPPLDHPIPPETKQIETLPLHLPARHDYFLRVIG